MANALKGKTSVSIIYITPNERATEALRVFIEGHMEYMRTKSHETGPLKLICDSVSEAMNGQIIHDSRPFRFLKQLREGFFICSKFMKI